MYQTTEGKQYPKPRTTMEEEEGGLKAPCPDIEVLLSQLLEGQGISEESSLSDQKKDYPESLLQQTDKANKYYSSFQRFTKQFIPETDSTSIIRWNNSSIETTQRLIVEKWANTNFDRRITESDPQGDAETKADDNGGLRRSKTLSKNTSGKSLFSWSTGDSYIKARKKELEQRRNGANLNAPTNGHKRSVSTPNASALSTAPKPIARKNEQLRFVKEELIQESDLGKKLNLGTPDASVMNKLNMIVEKESNSFIHKRIQLIRAHHSEQISRKIHERKRRDHEKHLRRLREKEEEYETALRAAMLGQNHVRNSGFFGSLFGFNSMNVSHNHQSRESLHSSSSRPSIDNSRPSTSEQNSQSSTKRSKRFSFIPVSGLSLWGSPKADTKEKIFDLEDEQKRAAENGKEESSRGQIENDKTDTASIDMEKPSTEDDPKTNDDNEGNIHNDVHNQDEDISQLEFKENSGGQLGSGDEPTIVGTDEFEELTSSPPVKSPDQTQTNHDFMNLGNSNGLVSQIVDLPTDTFPVTSTPKAQKSNDLL